MNRRIALTALFGLVAVVVLFFAFQWFSKGRFEIATNNAYIRADITLVAAKSDAFVRSIKVIDNTKVMAGAVLVELDPQDSDARVALARANLSAAEANLARAQAMANSSVASVRSAEAQITLQGDIVAEARAAVAAAQAQKAVAVADRSRFASLAKQGYLAPSRLESADASAKARAAQLAQAEAAVAAQSAQVQVYQAARDKTAADAGAANAAVASSLAAVEAAKAALQTALNDRGYTEVRAPVTGLAANRTVQPGQLVRPGMQLMAIVPLDQVFVVANFKETQIEQLQPGQKVRFKVDAFPDLVVTGRVESLSPASGSQFSLLPTDTATGNFTKITQRVPVRISVDPEWRNKEILRPGMSVHAVVDIRGEMASKPTAAKVATK